MISIKNKLGVETLVFARTFEYEAYDQIKKLINFEAYINSKVRVMPDAHAGKGCVVGTTIQLMDKVTPNLVGVDIGCGVLTIKLKNTEIDFEKLDSIIKLKVPHGTNIHHTGIVRFEFDELICKKYVDLNRASLSLGSLGGGNHFIEVSKNSEGEYFLIIHSGSRKLGVEVCTYYQTKAFQPVNEMKKVKDTIINKLKSEGRDTEINTELRKITKPSADKDLAFLEGSDFLEYLHDMEIVQRFAVENRKAIANIIIDEMKFKESYRFETIHNYIDMKRMILRKGAVSAELDESLIIPINMRDGSLICIGKGNPDWNYSAPHGAGRLMSRSKAKVEIDLNEFIESMDGIFTSSVGISTLDEAPQAYKTLDEIVGAVTDTVDIIDILRPVYNFKSN